MSKAQLVVNAISKASKASRKVNKAVNNASQRRRVINQAGRQGLPIGLESARLVAVKGLKGLTLTNGINARNQTVTAFGHLVKSKAAGCDTVLITALQGDVDLVGLIESLSNHDSAYGRADTSDALIKRVREHCCTKRNGGHYFTSSVHASRPHHMNFEQREALALFSNQVGVALIACLKRPAKR